MATKQWMRSREDLDRETHYMNVDLDVHSRTDLQPLADALGERVLLLFCGRKQPRTFGAHFELRPNSRRKYEPGPMIATFCDLIDSLPSAARKHWFAAKSRSFNVGIQSGNEGPNSREFTIEPEVLRRAAKIGASIVFTIYAPANAPCWKKQKK